MLSLLPDYADPARLCALGKRYEGTIRLAELPRLAPLLASSEGEAAFVLEFAIDGDRRRVVGVQVRAPLIVECQRCLGPMQIDIDASSWLGIVSGPDEAERLDEDLDPLLVEGDSLALRTLIEDELILAVPPAPLHDPESCEVRLEAVTGDDSDAHEQPDAERENPFAVLAKLRDELNNKD